MIICSATPCVVTRVAGDGVPRLVRYLFPTDDAFVYQGSPDDNYGSSQDLSIGGKTVEGEAHRSFVKFDLSTIPPGSVINYASLRVFMYEAPSESRTLECHRAAADWDEGTITWNNQPSATIPTTSRSTGSTPNVYLVLFVTPSVQKFASRDAAGYASNYGWILRDSDENTAPVYPMRSKEYLPRSPYLVVDYYPPHLELEFSNSTMRAGSWVKMTVYRKTNDGEAVTRGVLNVKLSSSSTSTNKKFSLTQGGSAITELTIPDGSEKADFWYYDDKAGAWSIRVWTEDYKYDSELNYGDDAEQLTVNPGPLDHFEFSLISSPKQVAVSFSVTITAYDAYGNVKTDYNGTNSLSDTTGTISPTVTGAFVNGKWTGTVTISRIGDNVKITTSGAGKTGESNLFNIRPGPPAKLIITPSSLTMAAWATYSYLNISLRDANDFETTYASTIIVSLSTTSPGGEFRQFGTTTNINGVTIPAGLSTVKVDYYDIKGGTWVLTASAAGLTPGIANVTVIPDTAPPVTTITYGPKYLSGATTYVSGSTVFELSASDDASGVKETRYRFDGGSWNTYTTGFNLSTLADGSHTIGYCSSDRADNNEAERTLTVILDKSPPAISSASPTGSLILGSASVTFTVRVEDAGSGVKEVRLTVDDTLQVTMTGVNNYSKTITLSEGSHTWRVEAADNLDNAASWSGMFTLTVDTTPPMISGLSAPSNPVFGESTTITCQVSDELSGVEKVDLYYSTDAGSSWTKVAMSLQEGVYTGSIPSQMLFTEVQYYVEAVDNIGNETRTPVSKYTVGIPIWLYMAIIALVIILIAVMVLRRRKPSQAQDLLARA